MYSFLENAPIAYGFLRTDLTVEYANNEALRWFGLEGGSLKGRNIQEFLSKEELDTVLPFVRKAFSGETVEYERELAGGPFGRRHSRAIYQPSCDAAGEINGIHVYLIDTTRQKASEEIIKTSKSQFETAFRSSAVGMAIVSPDGQFIEANNALCTMLGYTESQLCRTNFQNLTHPDDLELDLKHLSKIISMQSDSYTIEKRYISMTDEVVWAILSVSVVRNPNGSVRHFVAQVQDITDKKKVENQLHKEHELAQVTLRSIGDAVITCDRDGRVTYLNPVAEGLTGWTAARANGMPISSVFVVKDNDGNPVPCPVARSLGSGEIVFLEANANLHTKNGEIIPIEDSAAPIRDRAGEIIGSVLVFHDVSEKRALAVKLEFMAHHDALTGLPNRVLFKDRLSVALQSTKKKGTSGAVLFCDLNRFKYVNDLFGHSAGDKVLRDVALRIGNCVSDEDTVCRWAGDEFVLLLPDADIEKAEQVSKSIISELDRAFDLEFDQGAAQIGVSVGISLFPEDGETVAALMNAADTALYEVKKRGQSDYAFARSDLKSLSYLHAKHQTELRTALHDGDFSVHYQPIIDLQTGKLKAMEALARLEINGQQIPPVEFIPMAEKTSFIYDLSREICAIVIDDKVGWKGTAYENAKVSINISPKLFEQPEFFEDLQEKITRNQLNPREFELELTENILLDINPNLKKVLNGLHEFGFSIALDDFGTGYSNLAMLREFPVDTLKIDKRFVSADGLDIPVITAILGLAKALDKQIVIEGVETSQQHYELINLGCTTAQGFLYALPDTKHALAERYEIITPTAENVYSLLSNKA